MRRIFVPMDQVYEDKIKVTGEDVAHMRDVLRMKVGDEVVASCGRGTNYNCIIEKISDDDILLHINSEEPDISELPIKISLYQALPKGDKLELVIQKAVELGAIEIIPVRTARCVVKLDESKAQKKLSRWQKIAEEASKQSGRGIVPEVLPVMNFNDAVERAKTSDYMMIPYELCESGGLSSLRSKILSGVQSISIFIGSEGGFESSEVDKVVSAGGEMISLGHRILRTETAAIAVLAHIMMLTEETN